LEIQNLILFLTASVLLTLMPGPDIIYVMMQSIANGKKHGIATAAGLVSGIVVHTTLIALGIAAIIQKSDNLFFGIKIFGAFYLFYLAFKTFKSTSTISLNTNKIPAKTYLQLFKQGFIMNVLNPKVVIFFLAFFPGFINKSIGHITRQIYTLGFLFMLQAFLIFSLVSITAATLTAFLRGNEKFEKFLKVFQIVIFIAIGIFILFSKKDAS
jgi:threonine/homoserine/homoserine lactone efflux protein